MPFSLSLKSLIRLQKRQLLAGRTKRDLIGPLIMLVSSHNLTSINDLCDRLLLLEKGHLLMDKAHGSRQRRPGTGIVFPGCGEIRVSPRPT